jgi:hypothetical protein
MKRVLLAACILVLGTGLFAYDAGDIHINIEGQLGVNVPFIEYTGTYLGSMFTVNNRNIEPDVSSVGFDGGLRTLFNYHFVPFFSANAGIGFGGFINSYNETYSSGNISMELETNSGAFYLVVPFGVRLNAKAFVFGVGLAGYFPLTSSDGGGSGTASSPTQNITITVREEPSFKVKPFLGWYADIGFDLAGRANGRHGFGMVFRIGSSFSDKIATDAYSVTKQYFHFPIALVFNYNVRVAGAPIGGRR